SALRTIAPPSLHDALPILDGLEPTDGAVHETIEITQGFTDWLETGFYIFTSIHRGDGWEWVGDHIRPRVRAPESWHWPVGVSLRSEEHTSELQSPYDLVCR